MIYLASPYSHPDKNVMNRRYVAACKATAEMMRRGAHVFSPIAHSHVVAVIGKLNLGWEFWSQIDFEWIRLCGSVCILKLDGWEKSVGVKAEISYAVTMQIPLAWIFPHELGIDDVLERAAFTLDAGNRKERT
jgi:Domain of unknown function (DUF1937)